MMDLLKEGNVAEFVAYHLLSDSMGDIDPQYPMLRYICDRYELNLEQRYWLAFLTGASYCAPTVFYMYNEFPDFEFVDVGRLERWWFAGGRERTIFQSDRAWIRSRNQIISMYQSYTQLLAGRTQAEAFRQIAGCTPAETYDNAYRYFGQVKHFGRFGMFLWLEAVYIVTGFSMYPTTMPWKEDSSRSSRNGLCFAFGWDDLIRGHGYGKDPIDDADFEDIELGFQDIISTLKELHPSGRVDVWNVETSLCAYKKWKLGQYNPERQTHKGYYRYPGYYLDRQYDEIIKLQTNVPDGVDWDVLWQFRQEMLDSANLKEFGADNNSWSIDKLMELRDSLL